MEGTRTGYILLFVAGVLWIFQAGSALAVSVGDSEREVVDELGPAPNRLIIGDRKIFDYDRGRVEIENGTVTRAELISEEAAVERRARREEQAKRAAEVLARQKELAEQQRVERRNELARKKEAAAAATPDVKEDIEALKADVLEARLRAVEAEQALLREIETTATAPPVTIENSVEVAVEVEVPYVETVLVPVGTAVQRSDPPPAPTDPLKGRYSTDRRLPPMGTPTFGGTPASSTSQ